MNTDEEIQRYKESAKISLATIGMIVGLALGGVGIAAMGGAIGVLFAIILGIVGFKGGSKIDALRRI
jgi:hypothetical protein